MPNANPADDYELKIDSQVEKFLDLKQKLTYFLITASIAPIAFSLGFVKDETKSLSGIWIPMVVGIVIGLLSAGFALFSLNAEVASYQKHLGYRYQRKVWTDLSTKEQNQWKRLNADARWFLRGSFSTLFAEFILLAIVLMLFLHAKTSLPAKDKPPSARQTVRMFDAAGPLPAFVQGSAANLEGDPVAAVCKVRQTLQQRGSPTAIVIGRSDRRELSHETSLRFGSNLGLAQQRAEKIGLMLQDKKLCDAVPVEYVTSLIGGSRYTDLKSFKTEADKQLALANDRRVQIEGIVLIPNPLAPSASRDQP
jgi:hypothetical protein